MTPHPMSPFRPTLVVTLLALCTLGTLRVQAEPGHVFKPLSTEEIAAIDRAAPEKPRAAPLKPRRILVFFRTEGFVHASIPYANEALRVIGARSGAYTADFSEDMADLTASRLASYDAVVFQNTTGLKFADPATREALLSYISSGKGFVGIHAATDNFNTWPEAQAMIGGHFNGHPWTSRDTEAVKVDDPGHPVAAAFAGKTGFWIREEIYQITGPYDRAKQHVLLSLDMAKPENQRPAELIKRTDSDFPIAWVKSYGKGRVFYTSLGHNTDLYSTPVILQHYLDGIQFALGDLPAPIDSPREAPKPALAPDGPAVTLQEVAFASHLPPDWASAVAAYDFGSERVAVVALDVYLRAQGPSSFATVEKTLLELLARPGLKAGARDYCLRTLARIGSAQSVPVLERLLAEPADSALALIALASIQGPEADQALLRALDGARGHAREALVNAVARRRLAASLPTLVALAKGQEEALKSAAVIALGDLGTPEALAALVDLAPQGSPDLTLAWAQVSCMDQILRGAPSHSSSPEAAEVSALLKLRDKHYPDALRTAALQISARLSPKASAPLLLDALADDRPRVRLSAAVLVAKTLPLSLLPDLRALFPKLDPSVQATLIYSFDTQNVQKAALPLALDGLNGMEPTVRQAALRALGGCSDPEAVRVLIASLSADSSEAATAAASLSRSRAPGVAEALTKALRGAGPSATASLLKVLASRVERTALPQAVDATGSQDPTVRAAAFAAVGATATEKDLPVVLALLPKAGTSAERRSLQGALLEMVRAARKPEAIVAEINHSLEGSEGTARATLLTALALAGTDQASASLARLLREGSPAQCRDTLAAIASSTNTHLIDLVLAAAAARKGTDEGLLALKTYLDLQLVRDGRTTAQVVDGYAKAWPLATRSLEQEAIVAALRNLKAPEAVLLANSLSASLPKT